MKEKVVIKQGSVDDASTMDFTDKNILAFSRDKLQPYDASTAIPQSADTPLGRIVNVQTAQNPGRSGFQLFESGYDSFNGRLGLIKAAQKTLDLQYYAISDGLTSNILIKSLLEAAERSVRVRILIDDITVGDIRRNLISLEGVDNIYIRIFNPVTLQSQSFPARFIAFFTDLRRTAKRMHDKALIADNQAAIIGGRNLGDEYFEASDNMDFQDLDIMAAGPAAAEISANFDAFWNARDAVPITEMHTRKVDLHFHEKIIRRVRKQWSERKQKDKALSRMEATPDEIKHSLANSLIWAKAEVLADGPGKITRQDEILYSKPITRLKEIAEEGANEFLLVSPYFVPGEKGVNWLCGLKNRGMDVQVLTNSLASTDVVAVHTGYRKYRPAILKGGITIHELKAMPGRRTKQRPFGRSSPSYASLHAKAYMIDRRHCLIGSFNFDPRSTYMNTEIALLIDSPQLAEKLYKLYEGAIAPDQSYRLGMDDHGHVEWKTIDKRKKKLYHHEPNASLWRRIQLFLIDLLPVEKHL